MVISTAPIVLGNSPPEFQEHLHEKVAFVGQAPTKVRGPVKAGEYIIASGLNDGTSVAVSPEEMAASQHFLALGQSWESSSDLGVKLVNTAVGLTLPGHQQLGREYVEYRSQMRDILEELEKAHIYIEQLHNQNKTLEAQLRDLQQVVAGLVASQAAAVAP